MINLLEGVPGSGKSYEAVVYHVLPALRSGRKVITNLPLNLNSFSVLYPDLVHLIEVRKSPMRILGRWDAEAANRGEHAFVIGEFEPSPVLDSSGVLSVSEREVLEDESGVKYLPAPTDVPLFGSVWDFYSDWRNEKGVGALFVIDECHVSFPKPKRNKPKGTSESVIEWFKLSRHFGCDVLLMTQRMQALEEDIAGLAEFHVRVRKAAFLGKPDHYVRRVFAGYRGGEVATDEREYQKQYFPLYQSHTQGQTVIENRDSDEVPDHLKWRKRGLYCMAIGFAAVAWIVGGAVYDAFTAKPSPPKLVGGMQPITLSQSQQKPVSVISEPVAPKSEPVAVAAPVAVSEPAVPSVPDPLQNKLIHMTGCMVRHSTGETICTFAVSQNGMPVFHVTSTELKEIGYEFSNLGHCTSMLTWKSGAPRPVVCDMPSVGLGVQKMS